MKQGEKPNMDVVTGKTMVEAEINRQKAIIEARPIIEQAAKALGNLDERTQPVWLMAETRKLAQAAASLGLLDVIVRDLGCRIGAAGRNLAGRAVEATDE